MERITTSNYTFTTRLESVFNQLEEEFATVCGKMDFRLKLKALKEAENYSDYMSRLKELTGLLDMIGKPYELGKDYQYYEDLVDSCDLPDDKDVENRIMYSLYRVYKSFPDPEAYMKRLVDRLSLDEDGWGEDTLRLRILKRFIKHTDCLKYCVETDEVGKKPGKRTVSLYGGEMYIKKYIRNTLGKECNSVEDMLENIDDGVFDVLKDASKEQVRPKGVYGLLNMCDELANACFKTGGVTKRALYMFAMAYKMTFFSGDTRNGEIMDEKTDLEKNLFRDFYTNNLLRFLSQTYEDSNLGEFDLDPSGQGINYKNFAEMVYLYYISRDMNPVDKIKGSNEMINRLIKRSKNNEEKTVPEDVERNTLFYRNFFRIEADGVFVEDVLGLSEKEFEDFIYNNYEIYSSGNTSPLEINNDQQTAYKEYLKLLSDLIVEMRDQSDVRTPKGYSLAALPEKDQRAERAKWLKECHYGLRFTDTRAYDEKTVNELYQRICSVGEKWPGLYGDFETPDREVFEKFLKVLTAADSYIAASTSSRSIPRALSVSDPSEVTRTSIVAAYYYYHTALHEFDPEGTWHTFEELYDSYCACLNPILEAAHYQKLGGKNFFDILIIFSSYAMQNIA